MISSSIRTNIDEFRQRLKVDKEAGRRAVREGMRDAKEPVRQTLQSAMRSSFNVRGDRFLRTWRIGVRQNPNRMAIDNIAKGFFLHAEGGTIGPRNARALLIPINTYLGARIGTKKFYAMIDWLMREKLTLIRGNILYVKPPLNETGRGGVAPGTRVNKKFRRRFQGTKRRPSGFSLMLNEEKLTPIAVIKRSITMRRRFNMDDVTQRRLIPLVLDRIGKRFEQIR